MLLKIEHHEHNASFVLSQPQGKQIRLQFHIEYVAFWSWASYWKTKVKNIGTNPQLKYFCPSNPFVFSVLFIVVLDTEHTFCVTTS